MNMNQKHLSLVLIVVVLLGVGAYALTFRNTEPSDSVSEGNATSTLSVTATTDETSEYIPVAYSGSLATSTTGDLVYTNEHYGFRFTVPSPFYRIGDDNVVDGTLQFFNYPEVEQGKGGPSPGKWKIEAGISDLKMFASTSAEGRDGDASKLISQDKEFVTVDGQEAVRVTEHHTPYNTVYYNYSIMLPHSTSTTFSIGSFVPGEESLEVMQALDKLIATFEWLES